MLKLGTWLNRKALEVIKEFASKENRLRALRYVAFCTTTALVVRIETGLAGLATEIKPTLINIDYLLIGATAAQPLIFAFLAFSDFLMAVARGGFFGISDIPVLIGNLRSVGPIGYILLIIPCAITGLNLVALRWATKKLRLNPVPWRIILLIFILLSQCGLALRALDRNWDYRINSIVLAWTKNLVLPGKMQEQLFSKSTTYTLIPNYSQAERIVGVDKTNTLVVIFESWGADYDTVYQDMVRRYFGDIDHSLSIIKFKGSTIHGEFRELCGLLLDSVNIRNAPRNCLPAKLSKQGVHTVAFHGNDASFYRRKRWIPEIGFQQFYAKQEILNLTRIQDKSKILDPQFNAINDSDALNFISQIAQNDNATVKFYYFVSISSHGPYFSKAKPAICAQYHSTGQLCDYYSRIDQTISSLRRFSDLNKDFQILVVGDHWPYSLPKKYLTHFSSSEVPALYIKNRTSRN